MGKIQLTMYPYGTKAFLCTSLLSLSRIYLLLWNMKAHYYVHKSPSLDPVLCLLNPVYSTTFHFSGINILLFHLWLDFQEIHSFEYDVLSKIYCLWHKLGHQQQYVYSLTSGLLKLNKQNVLFNIALNQLCCWLKSLKLSSTDLSLVTKFVGKTLSPHWFTVFRCA
jgi:hypothetical protein